MRKRPSTRRNRDTGLLGASGVSALNSAVISLQLTVWSTLLAGRYGGVQSQTEAEAGDLGRSLLRPAANFLPGRWARQRFPATAPGSGHAGVFKALPQEAAPNFFC